MEPRDLAVASSLTQLMERQTVAQPAKAMRKFMCQGVGNGLKTSSIERNSQVNHVMWFNKKSLVVQLKRSYQVISVCKWSKKRNNNNNNNNTIWGGSV